MTQRMISTMLGALALAIASVPAADAGDKSRHDRDDDPFVGGFEIKGSVGAVDPTSARFDLNGRTIRVTAATLMDASILEAARGVELARDDVAFGDVPEPLDQLLRPGDRVEVRVDAAGAALQIEDDD